MERVELLKRIKAEVMAENSEKAIDLINQMIREEEAVGQQEEISSAVPRQGEIIDFGEPGKGVIIRGNEVHVTVNYFSSEA